MFKKIGSFCNLLFKAEKISHPLRIGKNITSKMHKNGRNFKIFSPQLGAYYTAKIISLKLGENSSTSELKNEKFAIILILYALKAHILY